MVKAFIVYDSKYCNTKLAAENIPQCWLDQNLIYFLSISLFLSTHMHITQNEKRHTRDLRTRTNA
jgi:hypothetical protein